MEVNAFHVMAISNGSFIENSAMAVKFHRPLEELEIIPD